MFYGKYCDFTDHSVYRSKSRKISRFPKRSIIFCVFRVEMHTINLYFYKNRIIQFVRKNKYKGNGFQKDECL